MGGRGAFLINGGFSGPNNWYAVGMIYGIKVLMPTKGKSLSLPERSNTPGTSYLLYKPDGTFKQLRVFGDDRIPRYDIDYHIRNGKMDLHKHKYINGQRNSEHIPLSKAELARYEKFLKGWGKL